MVAGCEFLRGLGPDRTGEEFHFVEVRGLDGGEEGFEGYADAMVRMGLMEKWDMGI